VTVLSLATGGSGGLAPSDAKIMRTAMSAKGDLLAVADEQGLLAVFDLSSGESKHNFPAGMKREVTGLAFSGTGDKLAAACGSGELLVFNMETGKQETSRKVADTPLRSVAWSEAHLAFGTAAGDVTVEDAATSKAIVSWKGEPLEVASLAFSPDGTTLAIGLRAGDANAAVPAPLHIWKFNTEKAPQALNGHKMGVNSVRFAGKNTTLLSASHDWTIRVWDVP
jgi:WD40 repeat protein